MRAMIMTDLQAKGQGEKLDTHTHSFKGFLSV